MEDRKTQTPKEKTGKNGETKGIIDRIIEKSGLNKEAEIVVAHRLKKE